MSSRLFRGNLSVWGENDGEISHFSEWRLLDPKLQEKFKAIRKELSEFMEEFIPLAANISKTE
jgi:hypothetical protein